MLSFKNSVAFLGIFCVSASVALLGIVPDKLWAPYLTFSLALATLTLLRFSWFKTEWALFFTMLCLCLAMMDIALRILGGHLIYPRPEDRYLNRWPVFPELSRFQKNVDFEGEVYGDLAGLTGNPAHQEKRRVLFRTDARGYRNDPVHAPSTYNVFVVGDSNGAGMNASQDKIWPELLRTQYQHRVYNLSTGGSPWDYLMNIKAEMSSLPKDENALLFFVISGCNDLGGRYISTEFKPLPKSAQSQVSYTTFRNRSPVKLILTRAYYFFKFSKHPLDSVIVSDFVNQRPMLFMKDFADSRFLTDTQIQEHKNFKALEGILNELSSLAKAQGFRVAVVMAPFKEEVYSWVYEGSQPWSADTGQSALSRAIEATCVQNGMLFGDAKAYFIERSRPLFEGSGKILWWYDDTHWNDEGQALFARWIQEQFLNKVLNS